jgi:hypothetical protein
MDSVNVTQNVKQAKTKQAVTGQKRKVDEPEFEYDGKNRCLICKVDMGDCNPRQYCRKTYCENASDFMNESADQ